MAEKGTRMMGPGTITLLFLGFLSIPLTIQEHEDLVWRTKGGIIKIEPKCGETTEDNSHINVYADFPVVVQLVCRGGVLVTPVTQDGVKHSQVAAFSSGSGEQCLFDKMENSHVYTLKLKIGWDGETAAVHQAREFFLIDCIYDKQASNRSSPNHIDTSQHIYDEVIHNMGPVMDDPNVHLEVADIIGRSLSQSDITIGRIIKLQAVITGPKRLRPVNCIATNGAQMYRILLGGCGDGVVVKKNVGFTVKENIISSPFFVAFRLPGPNTLTFKCNFTECVDTNTCDGSSCYKQNRSKRSAKSLEPDVAMVPNRRSRQSVCRLDSTDPEASTSVHPRCIERREHLYKL